MLKYKKVINMRILIIEDEFNLADVIASRLKKEKIYGFEILNKIRKKRIKSKVIMLTAKKLIRGTN